MSGMIVSGRELTKEEIDEYREVFDTFDLDKSGEIDEIELEKFMRSLGFSTTDEQIHDMMRMVDIDNSGSISFEEFVILMKKCQLETDFDKEIREAFKVFDQDGSGDIEKDELVKTMKKLGANLTDEEIDMLIREADIDGDGKISINEFLKIMYQ